MTKSKKSVEIVEDDATDKKRGRKTKSNKLVVRELLETPQPVVLPNIILHLRCSLKDLENYNQQFKQVFKNSLCDYNPEIPPEIRTYNEDALLQTLAPYETDAAAAATAVEPQPIATVTGHSLAYGNDLCIRCKQEMVGTGVGVGAGPTMVVATGAPVNDAPLNAKIKNLKIALFRGETKKDSACFWCSYEFDNKPFHIPRCEYADRFEVYGVFCTPECAAAFLFCEKIDESTKVERYHLINKVYYRLSEENIRPAPDPHYLLDRFMGTLTIQEYRRLLKTHHSLITLEKPMTRILPELHSDNDGGGTSYKIKRASDVVK